MSPLLLITTVIINSNYDEASVLHKYWMPALSLTIVLMISITRNFQWRLSAPEEPSEDIVLMGRTGRMWTGQKGQDRRGYCYEVEIK